jgi:hypothetical protein
MLRGIRLRVLILTVVMTHNARERYKTKKFHKQHTCILCKDLTLKGTTGANIIKLFTAVNYELS